LSTLRKAREITDAKIQFVSLVGKAANKHKFILTKAEDGDEPSFLSYGRILKADVDSHYITGIVYEPMTEDTDGDFMTEAEITKAAYHYAKFGDKVDIQHDFEPMEGAAVVENWVTKSDTVIEGQPVKKGTWLMTVEVNNSDIWDAVQKGDFTGFSMGGVCNYADSDVDLDAVNKTANADVTEKQGLLAKIAKALGLQPVEKGIFAEQFHEASRISRFWNAFNILQEILMRWDRREDRYVLNINEEEAREAMSEFVEAMTDILSEKSNIAKSIAAECPITKSGKKISAKNLSTIKTIYDNLGGFLSEVDVQEEDGNVNKSEIQAIVAKALEEAGITKAEPTADPAPAMADVTPESIQKMVADAVTKALAPKEAEPVTAEAVQKMVADAVAEAVAPILKTAGLPSNLNGEGVVAKGDDTHYLDGIL